MIKSKIVAHYTGGHIQKSGLTSIARLTDLLFLSFFLPSFLPSFIYLFHFFRFAHLVLLAAVMFSAPKRKSSSTTLSGPRHSIKNEASTEAPSDLAVPRSPIHIRMDDGDRGQEGTDDDVEGDQSSSAAAKRKMPAGAVGRGRGSGGRGRGGRGGG